MQGILADGVLIELVLDKLLNRYLLMSLRANQNEVESVAKSKQVEERDLSGGQDLILNISSSDPGAAARLVAPGRSSGVEEVDDVRQVHRRSRLQSEAAQGRRNRGRPPDEDPRRLRDGRAITRTALLVLLLVITLYHSLLCSQCLQIF